jgi:hypothetical protein
MFIVPLTGFWLVKRKLLNVARYLSASLALLADASLSRANLVCLETEARKELDLARRLVSLAFLPSELAVSCRPLSLSSLCAHVVWRRTATAGAVRALFGVA